MIKFGKKEVTIIVKNENFCKVSDKLNEEHLRYQINRADRNDISLWHFKVEGITRRKAANLKTKLYPSCDAILYV